MKNILAITLICVGVQAHSLTVDEFFDLYAGKIGNSTVDKVNKLSATYYAEGAAASIMMMNAYAEQKINQKIFCSPIGLPIGGTLLIELVSNFRKDRYSMLGADWVIDHPFSAIAIDELRKIFPCN